MRARARALGWLLLGVAVLVVPGDVVARALRAKGAAFDHWVALANVWALPVGAMAVAALAWERFTAARAAGPEMSVGDAEERLAAVVLEQEQRARALLLAAAGQADDTFANVRFMRGAGRFREVGGAGTGDMASVLEYYRSLRPGRLVVLGEAGAGKTVLALELLIRLLEERRGRGAGVVPVLVNAALWDAERPWEQWLAGHLAQRFRMSERVTAALVRDRRVLAVVDGLDEMDPAGEPVRAGKLVEALNAGMQGRERAPVVVTCRGEQYAQLGAVLDRATHVEMQPLTGEEAAAYLDEQIRDETEARAWAPVLTELRARPRGLLAAELATPWRLTLAITTYRDEGNPAELIPPAALDATLREAAADQYREQVNALLLNRYVPAAVRLHGHRRYTVSQVERWLKTIAADLHHQSEQGGSGSDILLHRWWRIRNARLIPILHFLTAALPGGYLAIGSLSAGTRYFIVLVPILLITLTTLREPNPKRLNFRLLETSKGRRTTVKWLAGGLVFAVVFGVGLKVVYSSRAVGLVVGLAGLAAGLMFGLRDSTPQSVRPRDVIRADGRYGFAVGLAVSVAAGFAFGFSVAVGPSDAQGDGFGLSDGLRVGLINGFFAVLDPGLPIGLSVVLAFGAGVWMRYHLGVVCAAGRESLPLRFGSFLDWAYKAGLLRVSGISYQFRHRQLQDWLTPPPQLRQPGHPVAVVPPSGKQAKGPG